MARSTWWEGTTANTSRRSKSTIRDADLGDAGTHAAWTGRSRSRSATNGKIYTIGGRPTLYMGGGAALTSVEEYDPLTDTWSETTPIRVAREFMGAVQAGNGKIYVIGGKGYADQPIPTEEGTM